jgi:hypothetical protein
MINQIVFEMKWLPNQIGSLFVDNQDYLGIEYWFDAIEQRKPKKK